MMVIIVCLSKCVCFFACVCVYVDESLCLYVPECFGVSLSAKVIFILQQSVGLPEIPL